jgi:hypothetical protein
VWKSEAPGSEAGPLPCDASFIPEGLAYLIGV